MTKEHPPHPAQSHSAHHEAPHLSIEIRFCTLHRSIVITDVDDPDKFYLCEKSNRIDDQALCQVVEAEISWR